MKESQEKYPLVSIAIITYNQKEFLRECIESCLAQTYKNLEIVVADDASTDGTQDLLRSYDKKYPGLFVLRLADKNSGITYNSNQAHFSCTGKYIAWMGGDDLMLPDKLATQVEHMESNPNCSICYHNLDVFDSDTNSTLYFFNDRLKISGDIKTSIRKGTFNGGCSTMVRRTSCPEGGFDNRITMASDWLFWVDVLSKGGRIEYIDKVLGRYRRHANNITKKSQSIVNSNEVDHLNSCNIMLAKYPEYTSDILYAYSLRLVGLRKKLNYRNVMFVAFKISGSLKVLFALIISLITFGRVKL
ncbi:glycosyltransferase family 2 protein [Vibrio vulnificus]|nr:glycosyltransferase [Vibrio vulnificus]